MGRTRPPPVPITRSHRTLKACHDITITAAIAQQRTAGQFPQPQSGAVIQPAAAALTRSLFGDHDFCVSQAVELDDGLGVAGFGGGEFGAEGEDVQNEAHKLVMRFFARAARPSNLGRNKSGQFRLQ